MSIEECSSNAQVYALIDMIDVAPRKASHDAHPSNGESLHVLTRYSQQFFQERVDHVSLQTCHYRGTVPHTWQKVQEENRQRGPQEIPDRNNGTGSSDAGARHIQELLQRIRNAGIVDVVLEAAHAYSYQSMDDASFVRSMELQYAEARRLSAALIEQRIRVCRVLFIDNYNPNPSTGALEENLDTDAYIKMANAHGFAPDYLMWEADMAPIAKVMIEYMQRYQSLVMQKEQGDREGGSAEIMKKSLHLSHRGIELHRLDTDKVSCAALDAALSLLKYKHFGQGIVNILPKRQNGDEFSFRGQQRKVRQILMDHLGVRVMPFFNIFTSEEDSAPHSSGAHHALRKKTH